MHVAPASKSRVVTAPARFAPPVNGQMVVALRGTFVNFAYLNRANQVIKELEATLAQRDARIAELEQKRTRSTLKLIAKS